MAKFILCSYFVIDLLYFENFSPKKTREFYVLFLIIYFNSNSNFNMDCFMMRQVAKLRKKKFAFQNWPQMWNKRATPIYASRLWYYHPSPKHNVIQYEGKLHCKHCVWIKLNCWKITYVPKKDLRKFICSKTSEKK